MARYASFVVRFFLVTSIVDAFLSNVVVAQDGSEAMMVVRFKRRYLWVADHQRCGWSSEWMTMSKRQMHYGAPWMIHTNVDIKYEGRMMVGSTGATTANFDEHEHEHENYSFARCRYIHGQHEWW